MANGTFLDYSGLDYLWGKIINKISTQAATTEAKIPTKTSQIVNDSGFITSGDIPEGAAASTTVPKMDSGSGNVGTEMAFARGDHIHPTDTSRLATTGDASATTVAFTAAETRASIVSGESMSTIASKLLKYMNDFGSMAYVSTVAKSNLASDVQTSLGKADTALQSFTESDPTVPDWAKAASKPTYTASEVGALSLTDAEANYAKKSDITNVYKWKGSKATYSDLPSSGNTVGDVWNVEEDNQNYGWTGTAWDPLGSVVEINSITDSQIDEIVNGSEVE